MCALLSRGPASSAQGLGVKASGGGTFAQRINCADCKRSFMSALCYELITLVIRCGP